MAAAAILNLGKKLTFDHSALDKDICTKFGVMMHHGHS